MKIINLLFLISIAALLSCNGYSNKKSAVYKIPQIAKEVLAPVLQNQFNTGIDFIASGNSISDWNLEMNFDDSIRFTAINGLSFTIPAVRPQIASDSSLQFLSNISLGKISINIGKGNCNNGKDINNANPKQCSVAIGNIIYTGCGQFLYDSKLEGKWNLDQYKGLKILGNNFKNGLPYLHFTILENNFKGFDGCNNISGSANLQGKRIQFSTIASSTKICSTVSLKNPFAVLTNQLTGYKVFNELLYLYLIDDSVIIFKKTT